jgi:hypothetical protein
MQVFGLNGKVQLGQQLASGDQTTVHHAENQRVAAFKTFGDSAGQSSNSGLYLLIWNQAIGFCHDLLHFGDGIDHNGRSCRKTGEYTGAMGVKGELTRYGKVCIYGYTGKTGILTMP